MVLLGEGLGVGDGLGDPLGEGLALLVGLLDGLGLFVLALCDGLGLFEVPALLLGLAEPDGLADPDGLGLCEGLAEPDGLLFGLSEGLVDVKAISLAEIVAAEPPHDAACGFIEEASAGAMEKPVSANAAPATAAATRPACTIPFGRIGKVVLRWSGRPGSNCPARIRLSKGDGDSYRRTGISAAGSGTAAPALALAKTVTSRFLRP